MTQISITAETSDRQSLEEARALIDRLLMPASPQPPDPRATGASADTPRGPEPNGPGEAEVAQQFVDDLWGRTGDGLHGLISVMGSFDDRFTLVNISEETGETLSKTHSRFASLGRSIKAARNNVPGAPDLFIAHQQPGDLWQFSVPESIRAAIRKAKTR